MAILSKRLLRGLGYFGIAVSKFIGICIFFAVTLFADPPVTRYLIDPSTRGDELVKMITTLNTSPFLSTYSEVALQAGDSFLATPNFAPSVTGGFIPYVQSVVAAKNKTLLVVTYKGGSPIRDQYLVMPVEQVSAIMYSPKEIVLPSFQTSQLNGGPTNIISTYPPYVYPLYSIAPALRAADIKEIFDLLSTTLPYFKRGVSSVGMFTTINGPFDPPIHGGFIPNIKSITISSSVFLLVTYKPLTQSGKTYTDTTIVVPAEQVRQLTYYSDIRQVTQTGLGGN